MQGSAVSLNREDRAWEPRKAKAAKVCGENNGEKRMAHKASGICREVPSSFQMNTEQCTHVKMSSKASKKNA